MNIVWQNPILTAMHGTKMWRKNVHVKSEHK